MVKLVIFGVALMAAVVYGSLDAEKAVARSSQEFAGAVYKRLQHQSGNLLICPVSVQTVMALVQQGAGGQTSNEIATILNLPSDKNLVKEGYKSLMNSFRKSDKVTMDIANRVFIKEGVNISPNFQKEANEYFDAGVQNVDFNKADVAAGQINQWVEQKTHDKIKNLISPDSLSSFTRMVLVNALYFKGTWLKKFEEYATREDNFYLNERDSVKVPMMTLTDQFQYASNSELDCQFLELPYDGNEYAMTIVLPNKRDGLPALESRISDVLLPQEFRSERVQLRMPKFKIESTIKFTEILKQMGMSRSFSDEADFSGLLESKEALKISEVIQKNFINVTEAGTEAASATAVGVVTLSLSPSYADRIQFHADHPFIYILRKRLRPQIQLFQRGQFAQHNDQYDQQVYNAQQSNQNVPQGYNVQPNQNVQQVYNTNKNVPLGYNSQQEQNIPQGYNTQPDRNVQQVYDTNKNIPQSYNNQQVYKVQQDRNTPQGYNAQQAQNIPQGNNNVPQSYNAQQNQNTPQGYNNQEVYKVEQDRNTPQGYNAQQAQNIPQGNNNAPQSYNGQQNQNIPQDYNNQQDQNVPQGYNNQQDQNIQQSYDDQPEYNTQPDYNVQKEFPPERDMVYNNPPPPRRVSNERNEGHNPQYEYNPESPPTNINHERVQEMNFNLRVEQPGFISSIISHIKGTAGSIKHAFIRHKRDTNALSKSDNIILFIGRYVNREY